MANFDKKIKEKWWLSAQVQSWFTKIQSFSRKWGQLVLEQGLCSVSMFFVLVLGVPPEFPHSWLSPASVGHRLAKRKVRALTKRQPNDDSLSFFSPLPPILPPFLSLPRPIYTYIRNNYICKIICEIIPKEVQKRRNFTEVNSLQNEEPVSGRNRQCA